MHTHFKAAIDGSCEGAGDIKAPLNLSDGAFHVGATKGFGEEYEWQRCHEELENTHTHDNNSPHDPIHGIDWNEWWAVSIVTFVV